MNVDAVGILIFIFSISSFFAILYSFIENLNFSHKIIFPIVWLTEISLITWLIVAYNQPYEIEKESFHKIVTVNYENNSCCQFINVNGENVNIVEKFGNFYKEGTIIKRILYKTNYCGINFNQKGYKKEKFVVESCSKSKEN